MLPGAQSTAGKMAYGVGGAAVLALCIWQGAKRSRPPALRAVPCIVVCDACGAMEFDRAVPVGRDGGPQLPLVCAKCGAEAVYLSAYCPSCGKPLPVDPRKPPTRCKHCQADLEGLFDPPARTR